MGPNVGRYDHTKADLRSRPKRWLITGAAGFIGSNLLEALLRLDQTVVGLDNYSTGHRRNLDEVRAQVTAEQYARFRMIDGDIREIGGVQGGCSRRRLCAPSGCSRQRAKVDK